MTTALYRRYRPETFEDVIGQSHVTEPLMTALRKNKVSHAYLFSGPRGCGKTTSARILARCLNCAQGPTATPCGTCQSCQDLARDGAGSLDVIEMDAASHGGVDDARQLRERATFAPVRDRYKIFIIDEAHMVTRDGFNALLKIVEEPPEHIKFIFATTEPSKVLPTIRSRTHHYPFRLVPPEPLMDYLNALCEQEQVGVEPGVQAMVVRAGGGSVRDSLSVLDQLMAGTDGDHIGYDLASSLLGYTHGALLDDVVDAFASGDAATVFRAVDRVIQTGQDPRRFVEDLLERFRDLVIVDAVPDTAGNILHGTPEDQISRLRNQAQLMGAAELSRAADITNEALTEMVGATSPQLHLELLCARLLLPSAENTNRGVAVRVDRLERRLGIGRTGTATGPLPEAPAAAAQPAAAPQGSSDQSSDGPGHNRQGPEPAPSDRPDQPAPTPDQQTTDQQTAPRADDEDAESAGAPTERSPAPMEGGFGKYRDQRSQPPGAEGPSSPASSTPQEVGRERSSGSPVESDPRQGARTPDQTPEQPPHADRSRAQGPASGGQIDMIRNSWTEVVSSLAEIHRVSWMTVMRGTPVAFDGSVLQLLFDGEGDRKNFPRFEPNLVQAIQQVIGVSCQVEAIGPGGGGHRGGGGPGRAPDTGRADSPGETPAPEGAASTPSSRESGPQDRAGGQVENQSERAAGARGPGAPGSGQDRTGSAQPTAADGGRATGPRPLQDSDRRRPEPRPTDGPEESTDTDGAGESGDFSSWDVAAIPGGAADTVPADAPVDTARADSEETTSAAGPTAPVPSAQSVQSASPSSASEQSVFEQSASAPSVSESSTPQPKSSEAEPVSPSGPVSSPEAPEQPQERAQSHEQGQPQGQQPSTAPRGSSSDEGRARDQDRPRRPGRAAAPQRRSGDEPSADAPVPPSPYDDIPWPDEPPLEEGPPFEDEPPFEDPEHTRPARPSGGSGQRPRTPESRAPEPRTSAPGVSTAPAAPTTSSPDDLGPADPGPEAPGSGAPRSDASSDAAHDQSSRAESGPDDRSGSSSPGGPVGSRDGDDTGEPDEDPPEQWRPSAPSASAAPSPSAGASTPSRRLSFRERHAAQIAAAQGRPGAGPRGPGTGQQPVAAPGADLDSESTFSPSEDDEAVENSSVGGRAVIERILGARLLEEIPHDPGAS